VTVDEVLVELETDKVVLEVSAPQTGVLTEIVKQTGETGVSGEVIARIDASADAKPASAPAAAATEAASDAAADGGAPPGPAAAKLLAEAGLKAGDVDATGPGGRVTKGDVLAHTGSPPAAAAPAAPSVPAPRAPAVAALPTELRGERRVPMTRLRQRIAERLLEAQRTAAILTTFNEVDMAPVMALRKRLRDDFEKSHGARLGFMSFFAKAAVQALKKYPAVNAYIDGTDSVYHDFIDIGVAVGSPRGLVVPVLRNVERMGFADIESGIADFGARAQAGTLGIDELTGGTFTISNGGVFGSMLSTPILNPPQSGILGMHKTEQRAVVVDGEIVIRPMMYLALSYDHRIIDGREAVQFLVAIKECIEDPARLLLEI
jgi:2-oxoglutarate dehydrogenase E2 component (dihydrolipoamide succinyltransferase)